MLKLLIIDDEEIICNTIAQSIDWASIGITLIGTCLDGVEAYHTILDECPDIVMTDIRMPGISGLELIERISNTDLQTQFIILSGYGEFEYAKRAMKCNVRHYLLKPCSEEQIMTCVMEVISICQKISSKDVFNGSNQVLNNLKYTLIQNMIRQGISVSDLSDSFFDSYDQYINLTDKPYHLTYLYYLEEKNRQRASDYIISYFAKYAPEVTVYQIYIRNILILFFPNYDLDYTQLDHYIQSLSFPNQATSITYERVTFIDLKKLLETLILKLRRYDTLYFKNNTSWIPNFNYFNIVFNFNRLIPSLLSKEEGQVAESYTELKQILESISNKDFLLQLADNLLISLTTQITNYPLSTITEFLCLLHQIKNLDDIRSNTLKKVSEILNAQIVTTERYSVFIENLISYVEEHISDSNLTLKWIAENYLYMNVNYVSRCFFRETGQKFSYYLMNLRVEKAKEIFHTQNNEKIQNVATLVGCGNNPCYLSKIFKKCTGMTPSSYIKNCNTQNHIAKIGESMQRN